MIIPFRPASVMPDSETVPVCTVSPCEMACLPPFGTDVTETFTGPGVRVVMRIDDVTRPCFSCMEMTLNLPLIMAIVWTARIIP